MICVAIGRTRHKMMQVEIQEAAKRGAEMIELRLDFLAKAPDFKRLLDNKPCPLVATVRRQADGGRWAGTEAERIILLRQAIVAGFDWVDLEIDIANNVKRFRDVKRIVSYHNLTEVPPDLEEIYERMCGQDVDIVKLAVRAQEQADNLRLLDLLQKPSKPTVAFCMGDLGFSSRLLGARCGTPFTYAAFNRERNIAPGIPTFDELKRIFHYDEINAETAVYGVIGDPIAHSLSPLIQNAALRALKINGVYLPFRVPRGDLGPFLQAFNRFPVRGYSVTLPHKEAAAMAAKHRDAAVDWIGAANTLVHGEDGFTAHNTDYQAALASIQDHLLPHMTDGQPTLAKRAILILGAGGVGRSLAHGLHHQGALVTVANRSADRAKKLAEEIDGRYVDWGARHSVLCDLVINCTSVGMHPNIDETPLHHSFLRPGLMVFDTIYTPETTLLIKEARQRACHVLTGVDMFVRQAALQFELFTGREAPLDLMHQVVKRALSPIALPEEE